MMIRRGVVVGLVAVLASMGGAASATPPPPREQSRIEKLIKFVEAQKGIMFVRNGTEYNCEEAGRFLRGKMDAMGGEVSTARQFIDRIASKSSMSGKPYQVRFPDGKMMLVEAFLVEELKRMDSLAA